MHKHAYLHCQNKTLGPQCSNRSARLSDDPRLLGQLSKADSYSSLTPLLWPHTEKAVVVTNSKWIKSNQHSKYIFTAQFCSATFPELKTFFKNVPFLKGEKNGKNKHHPITCQGWEGRNE